MLIERWKRDNNIFKFATKETTQDSFFSWVIHGINCNYEDRIENYNLAKEFLKEISPKGLKEEIDSIYEVKIIRQFFGIDILLVLNMNNGEQKFLIIENKTSSGLTDSQKNTILYYTKLLDEFETVKKTKDNEVNEVEEIFNNWEIYYECDNIKDNIYSVLIRTNLEFKSNYNYDKGIIEEQLNLLDNKYNFLKEKSFFEKHINFINEPNKLENLVRIFEKHQHVDKLIKDYYEVLKFNLENDSLLNNENNIYKINENQLLEEDKTHFRTAYLCVASFNNILKNPIDLEKIDTRRYDGILNINVNFAINNNCSDFKVRAFDFNKGNSSNNKFITENVWSYDSKSEEEKLRYIFLFTKQRDEFNKEYYIFKGLFRRLKQISNPNGTYTLIWEKCNISSMHKNGKISIKKEDIEEYVNTIENLSITNN